MFPPPVRVLFEAALFLFALGLGATAAFGPIGETVADALYFGAWCAAMLLIFRSDCACRSICAVA
jgi:hypothetical protein